MVQLSVLSLAVLIPRVGGRGARTLLNRALSPVTEHAGQLFFLLVDFFLCQKGPRVLGKGPGIILHHCGHTRREEPVVQAIAIGQAVKHCTFVGVVRTDAACITLDENNDRNGLGYCISMFDPPFCDS